MKRKFEKFLPEMGRGNENGRGLGRNFSNACGNTALLVAMIFHSDAPPPSWGRGWLNLCNQFTTAVGSLAIIGFA